jgi:Putative MetA-pathway of phenol degradation
MMRWWARTLVLCSTLLVSVASSLLACAQQMDPRSYSNVPIAQNFLLAGFAHSQGGVLVDPSLPIDNVSAKIETALVGYVRTLDLWGQSGTIGLVVPYASVYATGQVGSDSGSVTRAGFGDPALRITANLYGAPALSLEEFPSYKQDLIVGASLLVTAPFGQYDSSKIVNVGTNRWTVKPELGVSQAFGRWTLEGAAGVTFFTDNDEYLGDKTRSQDPLYAVQGHVIYNFSRRLWAALDATYYIGGRSSINGGDRNDLQQNSRFGATASWLLNSTNSLKFYFSSGANSRAGTDFQTIGIAWQYRWADR